MKTKLYTVCIITFLFICSNCSNNDNIEGGLVPIIFEKDTLNISGEGGILVVKSNFPNWGIYKIISFNENDEKEYINEFYIFNDGENEYNKFKEDMAYDWFIVSKSDLNQNELKINIEKNNSKNNRELEIYLLGGIGYSAGTLTVTQEAK